MAHTAKDVLDYIIAHPDEEMEVWRMKYSDGVMTKFAIGPYDVRWDALNTASFRKHKKENNISAIRAHIIKHLTKNGDKLPDYNIGTVD